MDMYAKRVSIEDAQRVFNKISSYNVIFWNALLGGYALHGHSKGLTHFELMCEEGLDIDKITFISLLSACSHGALVVEGLHYFESMTAVFNISAVMEDYACSVDLLGCVGQLEQAEDLIKMMPCQPSTSVWKDCFVLAEFMAIWRWDCKENSEN